MTEPIRLLFGSDFHFGVPTMDQFGMAKAFTSTILPLIADTDIFFVNGDFFDQLVIFDNHGFDPIYETILGLFSWCETHQTTLRVMQGTWEHDRNQLKRFESFYRKGKFTFPFRFINGIELEEITIRDRALKVFYTPDSLPFRSSGDIVEVIKNKLSERGWESVDYGCMHGFFDFTFPKNVSQDNQIVFKKEQFPFVNKIIDAGHVHQYRVDDFVFSNGSFDRTVFGDEDPKGCIRVLDYPDHYTAQFIQNKQAAIFDTLVFSPKDDTESISGKIKSHIDSLVTERQISLRFVVDTLDQWEAIKTFMKEKYPEVRVVRKKSTDKTDIPIMLASSLIAPAEKRIAPTRSTIAKCIRDHIPEDYALTIDEIEVYLEPVSG